MEQVRVAIPIDDIDWEFYLTLAMCLDVVAKLVMLIELFVLEA